MNCVDGGGTRSDRNGKQDSEERMTEATEDSKRDRKTVLKNLGG